MIEDDKAVRVRAANRNLEGARTASRESSVRAIASLLATLEEVMGDARLRGLPNLGTSGNPFYAAPVRVKAGAHCRKPLNMPRGEMLVLNDDGELTMVRIGPPHISRVARIDDLRAEDAQKLARTIGEALEVHLRKTERSTQRFKVLHDFSERLQAFLSGDR